MYINILYFFFFLCIVQLLIGIAMGVKIAAHNKERVGEGGKRGSNTHTKQNKKKLYTIRLKYCWVKIKKKKKETL